MVRGRKPKSTEEKRKTGNPGKRRLKNEVDEEFEAYEPDLDDGEGRTKSQTEPPEKPPWLNKQADKIWDKIVPDLLKRGLVEPYDGPLLGAYCQEVGRAIMAEQALKTSMTTRMHGHVQAKPEIAIAGKAWERAAKLGEKFGVTPKARSGMSISIEVRDEDDAWDSEEKWIFKKGGKPDTGEKPAKTKGHTQ